VTSSRKPHLLVFNQYYAPGVEATAHVLRPILAAVDAESETAELVRSVGCGLVEPPDRPDLVAQAIRELHAGVHDLVETGRRSREYVESEASRAVSIDRYRLLLAEVLD